MSDDDLYRDIRQSASQLTDETLARRIAQTQRAVRTATAQNDFGWWSQATTELSAYTDEHAYRKHPPMDHLEESEP